jgi:hypothetical protein
VNGASSKTGKKKAGFEPAELKLKFWLSIAG